MQKEIEIPATYDGLKEAYLKLWADFTDISGKFSDISGKYEELRHELTWLKRQLFGQKTERFIPADDGQALLPLFGAENAPPPKQTETITYERSVPKKEDKPGHGRNILPAHLPREQMVIEPEGDLTGLVKIGEETTEELEYKPGRLYVKQYIRPKYAKPDGSGTVVTGLLPFRPIDKGLPGPGLLAHVLVSHCIDHLPLYRLEQIFKREDVAIPRSTLCGWLEGCYDLLLPLYLMLCDRVLAADYLQADETPVQVLDHLIPGKTSRGYFFAYHGPVHRIVVFDYRDGRSRTGPEEFLREFEGFVQTDEYSGYDRLTSWPQITGMGCWAHVRRKFFEAKDSDPEPAETALAFIKTLYAVEEDARERKLIPSERRALRQGKSVPILKTIKTWLDEAIQSPYLKNPVRKAVAYTLNCWKRLEIYTSDGRLEIDNNLIENAIRPIALGRKNWLFRGSDAGAKRVALVYSLAGTCKLNNIEPEEYFRTTIERISGYPVNKLADLLPLPK